MCCLTTLRTSGHMISTGKRYTTKDAYNALDPSFEHHDIQGHRIWTSRVPHKVKVFSWLYFRDGLRTRANLFAKHVLDERCPGGVEDRKHVFFDYRVSTAVWSKLDLSGAISTLSDVDIWNANVPPAMDAKLWPFILQTILLATSSVLSKTCATPSSARCGAMDKITRPTCAHCYGVHGSATLLTTNKHICASPSPISQSTPPRCASAAGQSSPSSAPPARRPRLHRRRRR